MSTVKILVVEDEAIIAEDIASRLEKMGYTVVDIVATGKDAIEAATANQPNLVLMDIMLQGKMDGIEAAEKIRTILGIPVVYLTANADETTLQRAKITGPFGYVLKPFKEKELRATIEIALSRHQVELEMQEALATAEALRKEAQQLSQRKSQYVSMASHEFRTPLSVIKFSASLLRDYGSKWSEEKKEKQLQRIQAAAESMNQLIEEVLTLGRAESGKLEFNPAPLDAVTFCQELVEALQNTAGTQHTLTFTADGNCTSTCMLDEKLLLHIFTNILSNAIKYSPQGSTVFFTLSCEDERLCFQVKDQGIGISKTDQKRLFEPFNRASNVGDIPGTGLGLAIVKKAVELHGGQIEVASEIGRGTAFTVTLPLGASA
ncbi:MAG: ATP-binding protein [Oscillatoria sp. Prado101]|jgi:signal transduction histidine kinase|nr:ATP-binding protein [Oscillatoria sp. Prado101]